MSGSAFLLNKAVGNLITNASLYSLQRRQDPGVVRHAEEPPDPAVENAGARICEDAIPRLFEALYRAESLPNRRAGGSGLVLYRRILERHDAVCTVENTQDCVRAAARVSEPPNRS